MTPEHWRRAAAIAEQASRRAPAERPKFLFEQCGDDQEYRGVVQALLDAMSRVEGGRRRDQTLTDDSQTRTATPPGATDTPHSQRGADTIPSGEYTLLEQIGRGGFGPFTAWDPCCTVISPSRLSTCRACRLVGSHVLREKQLMARVRHRNVVTIFRAQRIGNEIGLAMELIRGRTLAEMVHQNGPLKMREVLHIGYRTLRRARCRAPRGPGPPRRQGQQRHEGPRRSGRPHGLWRGARACAGDWFAVGNGRHAPLHGAEVLDGHAATPAADFYTPGVLLITC